MRAAGGASGRAVRVALLLGQRYREGALWSSLPAQTLTHGAVSRARAGADVRLFDMVRRDAGVQRQKLLELLQMLDIWNLRGFSGQNRRERAWNFATRVLPCLTWMVKYNPRKQLWNDMAAGLAVSFLIVPQVRKRHAIHGFAAQRTRCATRSAL